MLKIVIIIAIFCCVLYVIKHIIGGTKVSSTEDVAQESSFIKDINDIAKVTIATIQRPKETDYSYLLDDIKQTFGKLYIRLTEHYESFNHCISDLSTGVYFGKTKYTGVTNNNGKREVALLQKDGSIVGKINRREWNKYEKSFTSDNLCWIGYSTDGGDLKIIVAEKFKEAFITYQLKLFSEWIADDMLWHQIKLEIEKQNLTVGEFCDNKAKKEKSYEDGTYDLDYNNRYQIAGCRFYVASPFVSVGFAENETTNNYNPKAIVIKTLEGIKVGYIAEKDLNEFYQETDGKRTPLIIEAHYYKNKLYGWAYTYTDNVEEYSYMTNQYHKLLKEITNN